MSTTRDIQQRYEELLGYKLGRGDWAANETKAAKRIAEQWTAEEFEQAYKHYKGQAFWSDKRLTLRYLVQQMPEYFAKRSQPSSILASWEAWANADAH